ncbi:MAG: hypothetical protein ABIJ23_04825 [Candidatus Magasanikbacteria bacterium]
MRNRKIIGSLSNPFVPAVKAGCGVAKNWNIKKEVPLFALPLSGGARDVSRGGGLPKL